MSSDTAGASGIRVPVNFSLHLPIYRVGFIQVATKAKQDYRKNKEKQRKKKKKMQCKNKLSTNGRKRITREEKRIENRPDALDYPYSFVPPQQYNESQLWERNPGHSIKLQQRLMLFCSPPRLRMEDKIGKDWACCWELPARHSPNSPMGPKTQQGRNGGSDNGWDNSCRAEKWNQVKNE